MQIRIHAIIFVSLVTILAFTACSKDGEPGPAGHDGKNTAIYYSEWFSPTVWSGNAGDWYFSASAPDLIQDVVENGVVLAYVWLEGDVYSSTSVRPLPAYALGANWSFLIHQYSAIEFTSDEILQPLITHKFRFIAIPGTSTALKTASLKYNTKSKLINMPYSEACKIFDIKDSLKIVQ
jgi:hypothetical protein